MKKKIQFALILVGLVALAGGAVYAQIASLGEYASPNLGRIRQTLPSTTSAESVYAVGPYMAVSPMLAPGDGLQEVRSYCGTCHSPYYIIMQPALPAATWAAEVGKMEKTFGAQINAEASQKIITYLQTHYTPETRKQ